MASPTTSLERPMPQNMEAERSILGAILLDNNALNAAVEILKPEDFFHDHHRRIYQQMIGLGETQQAIDLVTLTDQLHRSSELGVSRNISERLGASTGMTSARSSGRWKTRSSGSK